MTSSNRDPATGFGAYAARYAARRPGYPAAVFDALEAALAGPRDVAIELGAGSGQATAEIARRFARVIAAEPDRRMLDLMPEIANVERRCVAAEEAEFEDGIADAVLAATAFHWMDQTRVAAKAHRWLRSGGVFFPFMFDAMRIEGAGRAAFDRAQKEWAPFKDRRLGDAIDYEKPIRATGLFASVAPFRFEIAAALAPAVAARLFATASFVDACARARGLGADQYAERLARSFEGCGETLDLRAPVIGAIAVKA